MFLQIWPSKYTCANMRPNVVPPGMQAASLDKLNEVKTPWVLDGATSNYHSMIAYSQKLCDLWFVINPYIWPIKYPRANKSPNLFLQKCKQQHIDKLKEVNTPVVTWWLHITQSHKKLQFVNNVWSLTLKTSLRQHEPKPISTEM